MNHDMESWENDSIEDSFSDDHQEEDPWKKENEIFNSIQRARMAGDFFGESSGRGIIGDSIADRQLAHDIAFGMDIREALGQQRGVDYLIGDRRSGGILGDLYTDELIARDVESGMDIGEAIVKNESWSNFFDDLFDNH